MDERMRFVIRLKDGESMAALCREFQISRKTGYKVFERYEECGLEGLTDRARRPQRYAHQLPAQIEASIVAANTHRGVESCTSVASPCGDCLRFRQFVRFDGAVSIRAARKASRTLILTVITQLLAMCGLVAASCVLDEAKPAG